MVFAVRDGRLPEVARAYVGQVEPTAVVLHVAGAVAPSVLAPLRPAAIGQWHPVRSFVGDDGSPADWAGTAVVLSGDERAIEAGRTLCSRLSMVALEPAASFDRALYHAALAMAANGTAALAASAERMLRAAGLQGDAARRALGPLLASVAENVQRGGAEAALSGPVRRGDVSTVTHHIRALQGSDQAAELPHYRAAVRAQLSAAERLGEATSAELEAIAAAVASPPDDEDDDAEQTWGGQQAPRPPNDEPRR
ncbi:MAG: DUF2520 domain-containing protein [Myxococcota bacterium]